MLGEITWIVARLYQCLGKTPHYGLTVLSCFRIPSSQWCSRMARWRTPCRPQAWLTKLISLCRCGNNAFSLALSLDRSILTIICFSFSWQHRLLNPPPLPSFGPLKFTSGLLYPFWWFLETHLFKITISDDEKKKTAESLPTTAINTIIVAFLSKGWGSNFFYVFLINLF